MSVNNYVLCNFLIPCFGDVRQEFVDSITLFSAFNVWTEVYA